jgi:hypothetical protein
MSNETTLARPWRQILTRYQGPSLTRSIFELAITAAPLVLLWGAACLAYALELGAGRLKQAPQLSVRAPAVETFMRGREQPQAALRAP